MLLQQNFAAAYVYVRSANHSVNQPSSQPKVNQFVPAQISSISVSFYGAKTKSLWASQKPGWEMSIYFSHLINITTNIIFHDHGNHHLCYHENPRHHGHETHHPCYHENLRLYHGHHPGHRRDHDLHAW